MVVIEFARVHLLPFIQNEREAGVNSGAEIPTHTATQFRSLYDCCRKRFAEQLK